MGCHFERWILMWINFVRCEWKKEMCRCTVTSQKAIMKKTADKCIKREYLPSSDVIHPKVFPGECVQLVEVYSMDFRCKERGEGNEGVISYTTGDQALQNKSTTVYLHHWVYKIRLDLHSRHTLLINWLLYNAVIQVVKWKWSEVEWSPCFDILLFKRADSPIHHLTLYPVVSHEYWSIALLLFWHLKCVGTELDVIYSSVHM